jgi:predicted transcriptional regulator
MKLIARTESFEQMAKRSRDRARKLARGEKIPAQKVISFESPFDIFEVLTTERIRLCVVARTKPYSVTGLATALKRDPKSVRRDVLKLEKHGVLRTRFEINPGHGRVKIVEPVSQSLELRAKF